MKKIAIISVFVLFIASSCKKINEGINVDPNNPTDVGTRYDLLINGAEVSTILFFEGSNARLGGMWTKTFTGSDRQYQSLYNYTTTAGDYDDNWGRVYASIIPNAKIAEQKAVALNDKTSAGIAEVIQAMAFGTAADLWGNVPFTEASDPEKFPKPHFDPQATVYAGVQTLLNTAITNLSANVGNGPGTKDFFYGGSRTKWLSAAYTLKARFFLHTKEYDNAVTNALLGITSAANNLVAPHSTNFYSDINVYYAFLANDRYGYMSAEGSYAVSLLASHTNAKTTETSRLNYLFITNYVYTLDPNFSASGFFASTNSFPIITWQGNQLTLAEAYMKKATPDAVNGLAALNSVRAYYTAGGSTKTGSTVVSTTGAKYDPYLLTDFLPGGIVNPVASGQTQNQALLKEILIERYLTLVGQIEQYNDVRRTKNYLGITPVKGTKIPQRFFYAQSEINTNPNTPAVNASDLFVETPVNTTPY